ncbi:MAG TPA: CARDB domain-containing protein [Thermoanaerobaculia bacterium]|nr:CARDB domain-containing protein [Thermoanaerobaculia bacterium]
MKRALVFAAVFAMAAGSAAAQNTTPAPMPDLVITSFGLASWGTSCVKGQTLFTFSVGVKNQGTASWSGPNRPVVVVADMHLPNPDSFGTGVAIDPPLAPGETRQVSVPITYYDADPAHIKAGAPHPFHATVNRDHKIAESNFANNDGPGPATWNGMKVINVGAPEACLKPAKPAPGRAAPPAPTPTLVPIR